MKAVTLNDLKATAKDGKNGQTFYGYLRVYWDDATNSFIYQYKARDCNEQMAISILTQMANQK
jgi:hypothetical protein